MFSPSNIYKSGRSTFYTWRDSEGIPGRLNFPIGRRTKSFVWVKINLVEYNYLRLTISCFCVAIVSMKFSIRKIEKICLLSRARRHDDGKAISCLRLKIVNEREEHYRICFPFIFISPKFRLVLPSRKSNKITTAKSWQSFSAFSGDNSDSSRCDFFESNFTLTPKAYECERIYTERCLSIRRAHILNDWQ